MAEHNVTLELFYDGVWNRAPILTRDAIGFMRGTASFGNDTDPASGKATIDNTGGNYAPLSVLSGLYGKIGQNTPARISADGAVQLTCEVSSWRPKRPIKGSPYTPVELSGVLRRLGRGNDPQSALVRSVLAAGPVEYWPLDDGRQATSGGNLVQGGAALLPRPNAPAVVFGGLDTTITPSGTTALPDISGGSLSAAIRAASASSWRMEALIGFDASSVSTATRSVVWYTGGGINEWWCEHGIDYLIIYGRSYYFTGLPFGSTVVSSSQPRFDDGEVHHLAIEVTQTDSTHMDYSIYLDGVLRTSGSNTTGALIGRPQVGAPTLVMVNPDQDANLLTVGSVAFYSPKPAAPASFFAVYGWDGEYPHERFARLCLEEGITSTMVGSPDTPVFMGPQQYGTVLDQLDEIAATDDASIFETKSALGLTMRIGQSKLNQTPALRLSRLGQITPNLEPVFGDAGIRNDVTAQNPDGSSGRVQQLTGPKNVQAPNPSTQSVGRYKTTIDVNVALDSDLTHEAGWRVNLGTYDGTWYATVTADLDAAPGLIAAVNAVDIGDVIELAELPIEESLSSYRGLVIGIEHELPPKERKVTFHLVPAQPYGVGKLSATTGESDPFSGRLETDGSTTSAPVAAGAASFTVAVPSGPLWTTTADDFPLDVVVGGQRVTLSAISGASSPQTFTVKTAPNDYPVLYPAPSGAAVIVYQPIVLAL